MEEHNAVIEYLLNNANDAIRYRVLTELCDVRASDEVDMLRTAIIDSERYKKLILCLKWRKEYHGATLYAAENSLNMLVDMGVRYQKGFKEFDEVLKDISEEACSMPINTHHILGQLSHIVIVPFLLRAGMREQWVMNFFLRRGELIHNFLLTSNTIFMIM